MKPIRGALLLILWMSGGNPANVSGYVSEAFDSLMQRAAMLADHAIVPLYFYVSKHLVRPEVQGWEDNVLDYHYSQHLRLDAVD